MEFVGESYIKVCFNIKNNVNGNQRIASEDNALLAFDGLPHSLIHFYRYRTAKKISNNMQPATTLELLTNEKIYRKVSIGYRFSCIKDS